MDILWYSDQEKQAKVDKVSKYELLGLISFAIVNLPVFNKELRWIYWIGISRLCHRLFHFISQSVFHQYK